MASDHLTGVDPQELPGAVRSRYRLRPDRRLLIAIAEVTRLSTGKTDGQVSVEPADQGWRVVCGGAEVGVLPDIPSFADGTRLLVDWTRRQRASGPEVTTRPEALADVERSIESLDPDEIFQALGGLDRSFPARRRDPAVVRAAARGFVWLGLLTFDPLEQADPLFGETWALVAMARAEGASDLAEPEALLARILGYETEARQAAKPLPDDSPIKWFVAGDRGRLRDLCAGAVDRGCAYLDITLLAEQRKAREVEQRLETSPLGDAEFATWVAAARVAAHDLDSGPGERLAAGTLGLVQAASSRSRARSAVSARAVEGETRAFESRAAALGESRRGGLLGAAAVTAFYRAAFYGGLYDEARFLLDHLGSGPAAREFAAGIADPAAGTAVDLRRWIALRADVVDGSQKMAPIVDGVVDLQSIGGLALARIVYTTAVRTASTDPLRRRAVAAEFAKLDSRPAHLDAAARAAWGNLTSPALFERYARAAAAAAPHGSNELPATVAKIDENVAALRAIAEDAAMTNYARETAVYWLHDLGGADQAAMRGFYEQIAAADPEGSSIDGLVDFLERAGDLPAAAAAVDAALRGYPERRDLMWVHLLTLKAHVLAEQGKLDEAYAVIEPGLDSWKEEALSEGAEIQLRRGKLSEGLALARADVERYPNSTEGSALIAQARWRRGEFAATAKELSETHNGVVRDWSVDLPRAFAAAFSSAPAADARQALAELQKVGIAPHILSDMVLELGKKGDLELALQMQEELRDPAPEWNTAMRLQAYDLLVEKWGPQRAMEWIQNKRLSRTHAFALTLFQMRKHELLWALFPAGQEGDKPRVVRLLKAAALLHLKEDAGPRRDALVAALREDPDPSDFFVRTGLFLLGQADVQTMFQPPPRTREAIANVAWVLGMKAASERRFRDAESWFQVVLETEQNRLPPHTLSWEILSRWQEQRRPLERLAEKGDF